MRERERIRVICLEHINAAWHQLGSRVRAIESEIKIEKLPFLACLLLVKSNRACWST
jgi:hypothetical protein